MKSSVKRVGLLYHPRVDASRQLAHDFVPIAERSGYETWIESAWAEEKIIAQAASCDLLVTLGGDGTILRIARAALENEANRVATTPLLTIDFGTLGFLAELAPAKALSGFRQVLAGDFWIEERGLLRATLVRNGEMVAEQFVLNDVVLGCGEGSHAIRLILFIDDIETARYMADAMIIASPTGSTAYAMAAGGPIMGPDLAAMLAVPVAAHLAMARSFVIAASSRITLKASTYKKTMITLDGQVRLPYQADDLLHVTYSNAVARFIRLGSPTYFYATLYDKLRRAQ